MEDKSDKRIDTFLEEKRKLQSLIFMGALIICLLVFFGLTEEFRPKFLSNSFISLLVTVIGSVVAFFYLKWKEVKKKIHNELLDLDKKN